MPPVRLPSVGMYRVATVLWREARTFAVLQAVKTLASAHRFGRPRQLRLSTAAAGWQAWDPVAAAQGPPHAATATAFLRTATRHHIARLPVAPPHRRSEAATALPASGVLTTAGSRLGKAIESQRLVPHPVIPPVVLLQPQDEAVHTSMPPAVPYAPQDPLQTAGALPARRRELLSEISSLPVSLPVSLPIGMFRSFPA